MSRARYMLLPLLLAINAAVWAIALSLGPGPLPPERVFAEFCSTSAVVLMSTNAFISTRPRLLDEWFGGLDKLFVAHRFNGVAVAFLIATHFTVVPKSGGGWTPKLVPIANATLLLLSIGLAIAPRSPWRRLVPMRYHHWHLEHRLMGVFLGVAVLHSLVVHPVLAFLPPARFWVYGMATIGLTSYLFRETIETRLKQRHRYRVSAINHLGERETEVHLDPLKAAIEHRSGQFAFVRFEGGPSAEAHPFTISRSPHEGRLRFSIRASGDWTEALHSHLAEDSLARIEGPYGGFGQQLAGRRQLWLAGGIGITPFLAFLGDLEVDREVDLVWSVHDAADATYTEEIERAAARLGNVRFQVHATETSGRLDLTTIELGAIDDLWVFVCGPVPMRNAFLKQLDGLGVARSRVFYEEFSLR
jgi:predicted ferric reductase